MTYRFLKMTSAYPEFVLSFTELNPDHASIPYEELLDRFIATRYGLSDFYAQQMRRLGNEAWEVFASVDILQKAWAREHGIDASRRSWMQDVASAQVARLKPDVIFLQDLFLFDPDFRARLRSVAPRHTVIVGWRSSPTLDFASFTDLDLVVSAFPHFVDRWRSFGIDARLLPLAFEPSILEEIPPMARDLEFTFVGQIGASIGPHAERKRLIEDLVHSTPLDVYGGLSVERRSFRQLLASARHTRSLRMLMPMSRRYSIPADRLKQPVFGVDYYSVMKRSQATLNHHSFEASGPHASNLRLYEATGMGACLVTDQKQDLGSYFEVDREVVSYSSAAECAEKVTYLLDHPSERNAIARAGQTRTLSEHTYERRASQLDEWLRGLLSHDGKAAAR